MAGYWIKFDTSTSDKPEVWFIAEQLSIDPDAVVGKLLRVWAWFDDHTEKGNAPSVTKALLDRRVGVSGFCAAMIAAGWMVEDGGVLSVPNFDRHNGKTAKSRCLTAKRVANHKNGNAGGNAKGNAPSVSSALPRSEQSRREENTHIHIQSHPYFEDAEFADLLNRFRRSSELTHHWTVSEFVLESWLYDLTRRPLDEAKEILRLSTSAGAKKPIMDAKQQATSGRQRGKSVGFEEALLGADE
jgi:hypothetical protein